MGLNTVVLQGRIATDIELRHTQNGVPVSSFRIAVQRDYKDQDGNREVDFINVVCWRSNAEFVSRHMGKGHPVIVKGKLQARGYTDRDGNKRTITEVISENVYFAGPSPAHNNHADDLQPLDDDGDELPFM